MGMGEGEGRRKWRRLEGDDDDDDEEYVLEEEEYGEELSASSGGEEGEGSDAEYEEDETPRPKRRTNPAAVRSRQGRYEDDDDYLEELEEDEVDSYHEDLDEEEEAPRPKRMTKYGGRGLKGKLPRAAEGSNRLRHEEEEDMDFDPDLDEEEEEDMDFDPEMEDDEEEFEDEEDEKSGVSHPRKVRVRNTVRQKPASKQRRWKKKNSSSKVSGRKVDSAKSRKATPVRRRRKRSVIDHYEEDSDFIVEDQVEVNRRSRKKARVGRQIEVDHPVPVVEEDTWPTVESDTSDFDFLTSDEEPEDVEPALVEPVSVTVRKGRKKRICGSESSSDSEFHGSDKELGISGSESSSDCEFHGSDKELGDFREMEPVEAQPMLAASPRRISVARNGEDKGKEKKEPEEAGSLTCGICLSEEQTMTMQGVLNCCSHYFCFACIMEWSRVESRCPLCKRRFTTITKSSKVDLGLELIRSVIRVEERDQVYQPTEDEIRRWLDPYENVVCIECNQGGDDSLMLLCDICDSSAHTYCVGLGREVPEGSWYCGGCRVSGEGPSYPRSPVNGNSEGFGTFEWSPSIDPQQTFQGIDLNVSPREIPGENHLAELQASTIGVSTSSGRLATYSRRRQINGWISILLSRQRPAISPEVGHSGARHSGSVQRTEPNHRNFHAPSEANTSQHSGSVPRTAPNHRNFEAASEANTSQTLARRRQINEGISILLSRPRTTISPEVSHSGVQHSGSVPRTEPNHRNFRASLEANTSQLSDSVPRTEPNHRNFGATSDADTSQTLSTRDADLSRRRRINGYLDILLSRLRSTNSPAVGNNGVQNSDFVPGTEPNHRNLRAPLEANNSQILRDDIRNQHSGFPLVQAQSNFAPCISVDGNNFQQTEGVEQRQAHA